MQYIEWILVNDIGFSLLEHWMILIYLVCKQGDKYRIVEVSSLIIIRYWSTIWTDISIMSKTQLR